jgi:hypothetical protein
MTEKIKLVQNDTRPALVCTLTDNATGLAINITGAVPTLKFRAAGASVLQATIVGTVTDGANGVCNFQWSTVPASLTGAPGNYEGEISLVYADGTIQTVYDLLKFTMRADF